MYKIKSSEVFIKIETPTRCSESLTEISDSLEEASQVVKLIDELQIKEKNLVERWQKEINLANLSMSSAQEMLPRK